MSKRVTSIINIKTIKAYRGDPLIIKLGKSFENGTLTAWMKKSPNATTYRSFEIVDNSTIKLSSEKTSDYIDTSGNIIETVEGKWYFDVEFLPDGMEDSFTVVNGTILFINDVTNSSGYEVTDPNTGSNIIEGIKLTEENNLDNIRNVGTYFFDTSVVSDPSHISFSTYGEDMDLSLILDNMLGTYVKVFGKHEDTVDGFEHITQEVVEGISGRSFRRNYYSNDDEWSSFLETTNIEDAPSDDLQYVRRNGGWELLNINTSSIDKEIAEFIPGRKHYAYGYLSETTMSVSLQGNSFGLTVGDSTTSDFISSFHRRRQAPIVFVGANYGVRSFHRYFRMLDPFYFRFPAYFHNPINSIIRVGIDNSTGAHGNVETSTILNACFVGKDSTDTNLHIIHNDNSGIATKLDLGSDFSMDISRSIIVEMFSRYNQNSIYVRVTDPDRGIISDWIEVNSDIPDPNRMMALKGMCNRASDGTSSMYMEFTNFSIHV